MKIQNRFAKIALVGALIVGSQLGSSTAANATAIAASGPVSVQQAGNLGIQPMVCRRIRHAQLPWYHPACINLGNPAYVQPLRCRQATWTVSC